MIALPPVRALRSLRWRSPSNCSSTPWWTIPSRCARSPTPISTSRSTVPCSSTPARTRFSTYSRSRSSRITDSIPPSSSSRPSTRPAGPAPTIPTCVRPFTALLLSPAGTHLAVVSSAVETPPDGGHPLGRRGWLSLLTGVGLIVATVMPGFLTASLAPRIRGDFSFGDSALGICIGVFYVVSAVGSTPAGRLIDRVGAMRGMRLAAGFTALCCLAIAILAQSAASLTALILLGGVANALGSPTVSTLLKQEVAVHLQGLAFGAQQSG